MPTITTLSITIVCIVGAAAGFAAEELNEMIVTGSARTEKPAKEADFAISLPGGRGYQEILPALANVQQAAPAATPFALRGVSFDNNIYIVGTQSNAQLNFSSGGAPMSASALNGVGPLMWDIGEVIVERGPVLFGKGVNALGGEIRLEPRAPQFIHEGRITAEVGDYGSWRTGITENLVLIPDKLALRLNAVGEGTHGAVTNLYDGNERFAETQRSTFRSQLRWRPAGDERAVFDWRVDYDRGSGNIFGQSTQFPGGDIYDRRVNVNTTTSLPAKRWSTVLQGRVDLDDGWWVESEASFSTLDGTHKTDFDASSLLNWFYLYTSDEKRLTGNTRFGRDREGFNWFGGLYAEVAEYDLGFEGVGLAPVPQGSPFRTRADEDVAIAAAYGHAELALGRGFWITGGLRIDYQSREQGSSAEIAVFPRGGNRIEAEYTEWLPELGAEWRGKDLTAGLKVSRAYRPGGAAVAPSLGLSQPYGPERGWEANLFVEKKWDRLQAKGRVFHAWLDDQQVPYVPLGGFPVVDSFITNDAKSQRTGGEVEMVWQNGDFAAGATAGYLYTDYEKLILKGVDRSGQSLPLAPEWNAGIGVAWKPRTGWFGETSLNWVDTSYSQADSPGRTKLEARTLWSARSGYRWEHVEAYVFGSNLLDEEYSLSRSDFSALGLPVSGKLGMPRVIGTGITLMW